MVTTRRMTGAELRVTLDWLGLTQTAAAELFQADLRTVGRWLSGESPVPAGVVGELEEIAAATAQAVDEVTRAIRAAEDEPLIVVYRTAEQMWAERPETRPYPAGWWQMVAARALHRDTSGEARVVYRDVIRATWTGTLIDPETGERGEVTITSPVIDVTGHDDVDEVARWAVWFATPSWVMEEEAGEEAGIDDTTPPASVTIERVTGRAYATAEQLLAAVDNGETWEAEGRDGLEWS